MEKSTTKPVKIGVFLEVTNIMGSVCVCLGSVRWVQYHWVRLVSVSGNGFGVTTLGSAALGSVIHREFGNITGTGFAWHVGFSACRHRQLGV